MASHNILSNAEIDNLIPDQMSLDGLALWSNILSECGYDGDGHVDETEEIEVVQNVDEDLTRDLIVSARLCEDNYFYSSYVRTNEWKVPISSICKYSKSFLLTFHVNI